MDAATLYRVLMAGKDRHSDFARHLLAGPLALAASEGEDGLDRRLGLSANDLTCLLLDHFPHASAHLARFFDHGGGGDTPESIEEPDLRGLLLDHCSLPGPQGRWFAHIVARRSLRPNHLWQDLGLVDRSDLSRLMATAFGPLARANSRDMKWKKFFYRELCQREGVLICKSPVCAACSDVAVCFGTEDGVSLLARIA
jgi:nitrogen fixation protein NifQ